MHTLRSIPVQNVKCTGFLPFNKKVMAFALDLLVGAKFPPIKVAKEGGQYRVHDGRHRLAAHKLTGTKTIRARVSV